MFQNMSLIYKEFLKSWWILLFALVCFIGYEQGGRTRQYQMTLLTQQLNSLHIEMSKALHLQKDLQLQINSQSDPAWVELTLMKGLGLVPEGQTKVLFTQ